MRLSSRRKYSTGCTGNSGGNGDCRRSFTSHEMAGEDPGIVTLDRT